MPILDETARQTPSVTHTAARVSASLALRFEYDAARRTAVLQASSQEPPLKVVRAFILEDGSALIHLHNVSGGLLAGDQLRTTMEIGESAHVQVTTTGATRIYRSPAGARPATQRIDVRVGQNACLEYLPDPIIPFAGSRFAQHTRIHLDSGAGLFWWEVLAPGREACGELFAYELVRNENQHLGASTIRLQSNAFASSPRLIRSPPRPDSENIVTGPLFTFAGVGLEPANGLLSNINFVSRPRVFSDGRHALGHQHATGPRHRLPMLRCAAGATLSPALTNYGAPRNFRCTAPKRFHREK